MRVLRSLSQLAGKPRAPVLTIGNFDGVHRGHQRILETVARQARRRRGTAVALTFDPHPLKVLRPQAAPPLLLTLEQKLALLEQHGIDLVLVLPFTRKFSRLTPQRFVEEIIHRRIGAEMVCVGATFRFGHRQAGDAALLRSLAAEHGIAAPTVPPLVIRGETVASTVVRRLVAEGEVARVARLLGRPYALSGDVQRGAGRGATLDSPTLNMIPEQECLPARGVYVAEALLKGRIYPAAVNVGVRPTFDGKQLVVEAHLLRFARRITRGQLEIRLLRRLRPEKRFPSPDALRAQIQRDVTQTRRYFARQGKRSGPRPLKGGGRGACVQRKGKSENRKGPGGCVDRWEKPQR
jgi:riboflavin kinase/FMN adenylyltransferase